MLDLTTHESHNIVSAAENPRVVQAMKRNDTLHLSGQQKFKY